MGTLGSRLKEIRESLGLMQKAVAKEIGISNKVLSHYENNVRLPDLHTFTLLCKFYSISANDLLDINTDSPSSETILSEEDKKVLSYYHRLEDENKDYIKGRMVDLYKEQQNSKNDKSKKNIS